MKILAMLKVMSMPIVASIALSLALENGYAEPPSYAWAYLGNVYDQ